METWRELSENNQKAAQSLLETEQVRSCISRSYYAAHCAVTHLFVSRGVHFPRGWNNPAHEQLPALVTNYGGLARGSRYEINKVLRRLRTLREDADYRPHVVLTLKQAVAALRDAKFILTTLEELQ